MVSSTTVPFSHQTRIIDGVSYVKHDFYESVLSMRDELINDQKTEIEKLKQTVNKLKQGDKL